MVAAAKTVSQISLHMLVSFAVMYACTGSIAFGGLAAVLEPICNVVLMPMHDKLWEHIAKHLEANPTLAEKITTLLLVYVPSRFRKKPQSTVPLYVPIEESF